MPCSLAKLYEITAVFDSDIKHKTDATIRVYEVHIAFIIVVCKTVRTSIKWVWLSINNGFNWQGFK